MAFLTFKRILLTDRVPLTPAQAARDQYLANDRARVKANKREKKDSNAKPE